MNVQQVDQDVYLIQLDQKLTGFVRFIGAWLYKGEDRTFLVDVGPAATVPDLVGVLEALSVSRLDGVLLTHIHIDHAGGVGDLVERFPGTPVVCHQSGIKHLADPGRLWEGSKKTLGDKAVAYGPIRAVPQDLLHDAAEFSASGIQPIATPGHASHHVSYRFGTCLFAGEAGGVYTALENGEYFLRPATPPRFIYEISMESLDTLLDIPHEILCYGHFGATANPSECLEAHKRQLKLWLETISSVLSDAPAEADLLDTAFDRLLSTDPLLKTWETLSPEVQHREKDFIFNSIRGFVGYLKSKQGG